MPSTSSSDKFSGLLAEALDAHLRQCGGKSSCGNLHRLVMDSVEEKLVAFALRRCDGNCSEAARMLGISRTTLMRKMPGGKARKSSGKKPAKGGKKKGGKSGARKK